MYVASVFAENTLSVKINEGPFTQEFSLIGEDSQGRLLIASRSSYENSERHLLVDTVEKLFFSGC